MVEPHQTCVTCKSWTPHADERMKGYGTCEHLPDWRAFAASNSLCQMKPILWREKKK
ncbi:MAG TPA: hypothetical protein VFQ99_05750 [Gallionella sp.]|nr:hypothetical protein [Gallionella sp.]